MHLALSNSQVAESMVPIFLNYRKSIFKQYNGGALNLNFEHLETENTIAQRWRSTTDTEK